MFKQTKIEFSTNRPTRKEILKDVFQEEGK